MSSDAAASLRGAIRCGSSWGGDEWRGIPAKQGGRHTPIGVGYQPQFFFGTTNVTGTLVEFASDTKEVIPGDHVEVLRELAKPVGLEPGMRFAAREGSRTVGAGVIVSME